MLIAAAELFVHHRYFYGENQEGAGMKQLLGALGRGNTVLS